MEMLFIALIGLACFVGALILEWCTGWFLGGSDGFRETWIRTNCEMETMEGFVCPWCGHERQMRAFLMHRRMGRGVRP